MRLPRGRAGEVSPGPVVDHDRILREERALAAGAPGSGQGLDVQRREVRRVTRLRDGALAAQGLRRCSEEVSHARSGRRVVQRTLGHAPGQKDPLADLAGNLQEDRVLVAGIGAGRRADARTGRRTPRCLHAEPADADGDVAAARYPLTRAGVHYPAAADAGASPVRDAHDGHRPRGGPVRGRGHGHGRRRFHHLACGDMDDPPRPPPQHVRQHGLG